MWYVFVCVCVKLKVYGMCIVMMMEEENEIITNNNKKKRQMND